MHGIVQDKSGRAISKAAIVLNEGLRVYTKEGGYFHVLLAPGFHSMDAIASGYQQKHVKVRECPCWNYSPIPCHIKTSPSGLCPVVPVFSC